MNNLIDKNMIRFNIIEKLKLVFNFKKLNKTDINQKRVAVIDEGVGTTFINTEGSGPDGGLISKGKGMKSINSKWTATGKK